LTRDQELNYARLAQQGDLVARNHILHANLRLVVRIARRYLKSGLSFLDLIEEGNLGLMHALDKFDPELGFRFSTYCAWWIQQNIERGIMNQARIVRLPVHVIKELNQCKRACNALSIDLDQNPSFEKIATYLDKDKNAVERIMLFVDGAISLDAPLNASTEKSIADTLPHDEHQDPCLSLEKELVAEQIQRWLKVLSTRQYEVIIRRFGLCGYEPMTLKEISLELGLTKERIRQLQIRALNLIAVEQDRINKLSP
jgi:RNA polymerase nonessential primary-like sigma factor